MSTLTRIELSARNARESVANWEMAAKDAATPKLALADGSVPNGASAEMANRFAHMVVGGCANVMSQTDQLAQLNGGG